MREFSDAWKTGLIVAWCAALLVLYVAAGAVMTDVLHDEKDAAVARHEARLDESKVEVGRTTAETRVVDIGREPENAKVSTGIYVDRIFDVDLRHTHWKVDFYIWFSWSGPNVHPGAQFQIINGEILTKNLEVKTTIGDGHYELYRVTAKITKFFNISRYPRDDHLMTIRVEDSSRQFFDLTYVPDGSGSNVSSRVEIPGYKIQSFSVIEKEHSYKTRRGDPRLPEDYKSTYSQIVFGIGIKRPSWGLYIKMFIGIFAAVFFALLAFFVSPAHTSPRFGIGVGAFFASIASIYVISSQIPLSGSFTLTDFVTSTSVITIFLILLTSTKSVGIYHHWSNGRVWAARLDRAAQTIFAAGYVGINISLALAASL